MMGLGREFTTFLFNKDDYIGEVRVRPRTDDQYLPYMFAGKGMRVANFSPPSERCQPLLVMHSISSTGVWFTMDVPEQQPGTNRDGLNYLYASCIGETKTAVVQMEGGVELHLVAMHKKPGNEQQQEQPQPCFWGCIAGEGAYASCLNMLNLRCLALVFDLDETLIVANTMRSFEDRIDALSQKLRLEADPERIAGLSSEMKRYQEDQSLLTQYLETDRVFDNGKLVKVQAETVPSSSDVTPALERPIIRLHDRNIILTRINPAVRDTSVLVRLRPAWEELRNYLIAKGRKRFEVFICTMSEKDYALEMWRLLDPDARLIPSIELQERVVCVKAGSKKSLNTVFRRGQCHPRMAMVIDDRLKVWEDVDQPRVHVVPAFAPYYAPQAETSGTLPILCIARNIACNVRGGFFKDFDESLSQQIAAAEFDMDISTLPKPLDVSNYLTPEKAQDMMIPPGMEAGSKDLPDGMADSETESIWNTQAPGPANPWGVSGTDEINSSVQPAIVSFLSQLSNNKEQQPVIPGSVTEPSGESEEGEVPESELDPDTRRRLLILQHGQDTEHNQSLRVGGPSSEWDEEEMSPGRPGSSEIVLEPESPSLEKHYDGLDNIYASQSGLPMMRRFPDEGIMRGQRLDRKALDYSDDDDRIYRINGLRENPLQPEPAGPVAVLQSVSQKSKAQLEFKSSVSATIELQFCVEVMFNGEKIARGTGRTNREARTRASEDALRVLSHKSRDSSYSGLLEERQMFNGQWNARDGNNRLGESPKVPSFNAVAALKDLCTVENLSVSYHDRQIEKQTHPTIYNCEVEVSGQVFGRGRGLSWEAAKQEASEEALRGMKSNLSLNTMKRSHPPRSPPVQSNKRIRGGRGQGRGSRLSPRKPAQMAVRLK